MAQLYKMTLYVCDLGEDLSLDEIKRLINDDALDGISTSCITHYANEEVGPNIEWDDDIDLVMLREDYDKFVQIAPKWLKEDLVLQTVYTEKNYLRGHAQIRNSKTCGCNEEDKKAGYNCGIFIDIFPLDGMPKTEKERKSWAKKIQFYWTVLYTWYRFDYYENATVFGKLLHGIGMLLHVPMVLSLIHI